MTRAADDKRKAKTTRRRILTAGAAGAGLAVGLGLVRGFPTIWAQNIKDITLVQVGGSYSNITEIGKQATQGPRLYGRDAGNRSGHSTQPPADPAEDIDINDIGTFLHLLLVGQEHVQPVPVSKYKYWDKTFPLFTKGEYPDGRKVSTQGTAPMTMQYYEPQGRKEIRQRSRPIG